MSDQSIYLQLATELGTAIGSTPVYHEKLAAEQAVRQDKTAHQLVKDFQDLKKSYERMVQTGSNLNQKNEETLKKLENKCMENAIVKSWYDSNQHFYDLVTEVNKKMQEGMTMQ